MSSESARTDNLRLGVLGVGRIGSMHVNLLSTRVPGATVTGVFDVFTEGARAVADKYGVRLFESTRDLIESDEVDAIAICTSTDTHVDLIVAGADAGKPIFCEKPFSLSLAEVDRGLAAVDAAGVPLHIGFNRRFDPGHRAVHTAVLDGTVGELRQVSITSRDPSPPHLDYIKVSGGIFLDMTIHDFDMARYVTGSEVVEVYARGWNTVDQAIADAGDFDTVVVMLTHENGVVTIIDNCRQSAYGYDQRVEAFGSNGAALSENHRDHYAVMLTHDGGRTAKIPNFFLERYVPSYVIQWTEFIAAVKAGAAPPVTGADGRAPLLAGLAAQRSVDEHRPVAISEIA